MKVIIDIPKELFEEIKCGEACGMVYFYNSQRSGRGETKEIFTALKQGIPIEKGHGAIIDVKDIDRIHINDNGKVMIYKLGTDVKALVHATALVEADEENEE